VSHFNQTWIFSPQILKKPINIKFHENLSSGSRVLPCGRTEGQIDTTKTAAAFRNFANAQKKRKKEKVRGSEVQNEMGRKTEGYTKYGELPMNF
jgi:hypothetical protein